jgi:hypothetical protein
MTIPILLILLLIFLLIGVAYLILSVLILSILKLIRKSEIDHEKERNFKKIILLVSILIVGLFAYLFIFISPAKNYKQAFIRKDKDHFIITVKGKRLYMAHDPISALSRNTYEDSMQFAIPRDQGIINGSEIPIRPGYYKFTGTIKIENDKLEIKLFADNYDDKKLNPDTWNGMYNLKWQEK